ncbi:MAG: sel1 repeat family protein [Rhodospirillales bacterium]|nr:sel1 repeat family protein [Rhodospirillales bacterium]
MRRTNRAIFLIGFLAVALAACVEADVVETRDSDAETARRYLQVGVSGDATQKFNLALMYLMGKGVPQDYDESMRWMLEAAVTTHPSASEVLSCLRTGRSGVKLGPEPRTFEDLPTDTPKLKLEAGLYYWQRSCDPVDSAKAIELLAVAANADLPNAQYMMGIAHRQGRRVALNHSESAKWFGRAGAFGHAAARRAFCDLRRTGNITGPENASRTKDWCGAD